MELTKKQYIYKQTMNSGIIKFDLDSIVKVFLLFIFLYFLVNTITYTPNLSIINVPTTSVDSPLISPLGWPMPLSDTIYYPGLYNN